VSTQKPSRAKSGRDQVCRFDVSILSPPLNAESRGTANSPRVGFAPSPVAVLEGESGRASSWTERPTAVRAAFRWLPARSADHRWLAAALLFALLFAARGMVPALSPDRVQDDARHYVFWMARFRDPELFRDDLIADYLESVAPPGYTAIYRALSWVVDPLLASKLLPPVLGLTAALFTFLLARKLHPSPLAAFLAAVLLSWYVWQVEDISSGSPRSFLPLLAAQLWSLAAGRLVLAVSLVAVGALFHPVAGALGVALLGTRLLGFRGWRPTLTRDRLVEQLPGQCLPRGATRTWQRIHSSAWPGPRLGDARRGGTPRSWHLDRFPPSCCTARPPWRYRGSRA
jgi:hypothetical protein